MSFNFKKIALLFLILSLVSAQPSYSEDLAQPKVAISNYQNKLVNVRSQTDSVRKKVAAARNKEIVALRKLEQTQKELSRVQYSFNRTEQKIKQLRADIDQTKKQVTIIDAEINVQALQLKKHLKQAYLHKNELLASMISSVLKVGSLAELFNTIYYQQRIIGSELAVIEEIRIKQNALVLAQKKYQSKKSSLEIGLKESEKLKDLIATKKDEQSSLVNRLRGERLTYEAAERQLERESMQLTDKILTLSHGHSDLIGLKDLINKNFIMPVQAAITSGYGYRLHPIFRVRSFHSGLDFGAARNVPIRAANGGLVIFAGWYPGYGKTVIVSHGENDSTLYAHMNKIAVGMSDKVAQGNTLGYVGATGIATGPHLHFETRRNGKPYDPRIALR